MEYQELKIEGRNAVLEALRSGKPIDKLFVLDGCQDGPVRTIVREAKKHDTILNFVDKERLDQISETKKHQGVIAIAAAYEYAEVEDILKKAEEKGEPPFIFILDNIEDPHNLGAIIRTANLAGAHGVIIPKRRAVGLTATVAKTSAGAINYTPVAKVTNLTATIKELKEKGYQLKAFKMIVHNEDKDTVLVPEKKEQQVYFKNPETLALAEARQSVLDNTDRMAQFTELMTNIVGKAIAANNEELSRSIGEDVGEQVLKEMNYLMREREEMEEERFRQLDDAIRGNIKKKKEPLLKKWNKKKPS